MKKLIILMILMNIVLVSAIDRATLEVGESFVIEDKNITFVKADSRHDNAIFCVNGEKGIVREDEASNINGVYIELKRLKVDSASIELNYECDDKYCECGSLCNNDICFNGEEEIDSDQETSDDEIVVTGGEQEESLDDETIIESGGVEVKGIVIAVLITFVLLLGVIVLWKRG